MSLAVAIQMDPIEGVDIDADSTFALAVEGQARGHGLFHYLPKHLSFKRGRAVAQARPLKVKREGGVHGVPRRDYPQRGEDQDRGEEIEDEGGEGHYFS